MWIQREKAFHITQTKKHWNLIFWLGTISKLFVRVHWQVKLAWNVNAIYIYFAMYLVRHQCEVLILFFPKSAWPHKIKRRKTNIRTNKIQISHILRRDLQPTGRCSLVGKSRSGNTLTEDTINETNRTKSDQGLFATRISWNSSIGKITDPRLCIRPMVTASDERRSLCCSSLHFSFCLSACTWRKPKPCKKKAEDATARVIGEAILKSLLTFAHRTLNDLRPNGLYLNEFSWAHT